MTGRAADVERHCRGKDSQSQPGEIRRQAFAHPDQGMGHHRHHHGLETFKKARRNGVTKLQERQGGSCHQDCGWQGKPDPRGEGAPWPCSEHPYGKADLAGGGAGQELAERDHIRIGLVRQPFAPGHEFIPEIADMGDRTAECCETKAQKGEKNLRFQTVFAPKTGS